MYLICSNPQVLFLFSHGGMVISRKYTRIVGILPWTETKVSQPNDAMGGAAIRGLLAQAENLREMTLVKDRVNYDGGIYAAVTDAQRTHGGGSTTL